MSNKFQYTADRFADIQMLRYQLPGFEGMPLKKKLYIYYLSEATLWGRDIICDQNGKHNLLIRKSLEAIYMWIQKHEDEVVALTDGRKEMEAMGEYMRCVWFANGIHHHYSKDKFAAGFTEAWLRTVVGMMPTDVLPMEADALLATLVPVIFDEKVMPKRVNRSAGEDLVATSACNYYDGVTQAEVEAYYEARKQGEDHRMPSWGLNSTLVKDEDGQIRELVWSTEGRYGKCLKKVVECLEAAAEYAENEGQRRIISLLVEYYRTGDLRKFDEYSIEWIKETEGSVDFINGFIEVYGDPLGYKASWEGIVEYKDDEACLRTKTISDNAQWFEDHSPVDSRFKKEKVSGVTASGICAAMLGGDEYPSTAIGINLPNADWIRSEYGSKSVTITNITHAYDEASRGSGFLEEFVADEQVRKMVKEYGDKCDTLHTDMHECLGHGSGRLLDGTPADALKAYGSTIEEARADLFALYYMADGKMVELGLLPDAEAYKANYYTYIMNGLLTQCVRIKLGADIEEDHMRNRALIANWCYKHAEGALSLKVVDGKTYLEVSDYGRLRDLFARLLAEIQRVKSEGDYEAAKALVEEYGVKIDATRHAEVLDRYRKLDIAPYKGFINPVLTLVRNEEGEPVDVEVRYDEPYAEQMMRYSRVYSAL